MVEADSLLNLCWKFSLEMVSSWLNWSVTTAIYSVQNAG